MLFAPTLNPTGEFEKRAYWAPKECFDEFGRGQVARRPPFWKISPATYHKAWMVYRPHDHQGAPRTPLSTARRAERFRANIAGHKGLARHRPSLGTFKQSCVRRFGRSLGVG